MKGSKTADRWLARSVVWSCVLAALASSLFGDGGSVLFHKRAGQFVLTLFTASVPLRVGSSDLSVMVEDANTGTPLLDAEVTLTLTGPGGRRSTVRASRASATNKLLYSGAPVFSTPGAWTVAVSVRRGAKAGEAAGTVEVSPPLPAAWRYWPYFAIVPLCIALFVLHQRLTQQRASLRRPQKADHSGS
jgi:hypothetical protein